MAYQTQRIRGLFKEAIALLPEADRRAQKPGLMMANIYSALLDEIERDGFQVLHQRTSLTPIRKLWIAARTHFRGH
jgi:phytoene synthase